MGADMKAKGTGMVNKWIWSEGHRNIHLNDDGDLGSLMLFVPRAWAELVGLRAGNNNGAYYLGCGEDYAPAQPYMDSPEFEPGPYATPNARVALDMSLAHKMGGHAVDRNMSDRAGFFDEAIHWLILNLGESHDYSCMIDSNRGPVLPRAGRTVRTMSGMTLDIVPEPPADEVFGHPCTVPPLPWAETEKELEPKGRWHVSPSYFRTASIGLTAHQKLMRWRYIK
jgi:hypothetical protein